MTSPAMTVHRSTPLIVAARKMEEHQIHRLVVVEDGDDTSPIGVLSMTDLIHALAEETSRHHPDGDVRHGHAPTPREPAR
jgi:CBS-domain-containing membrane protein